MTSIIRRPIGPISDGCPRRSSADSDTTGGKTRNVIANCDCQRQIPEGFPLTTASLLEDGKLPTGSVSKVLNSVATGNQYTFQQDEDQRIGQKS